ncbi:MAG: Gfo/Idh/MocA family oxidoreductase [Actinomycetota bacterium]|nr:Gfo/Idh/MocA family oxidoreductase [Actinomycetota bacterium]
MSTADGMNYAPRGKPQRACEPGEMVFAAVGLDHGHINGMCNGLVEAGAELALVWDPDPEKVKALLERYRGAKAASSEEEVLEDPKVRLVACASVPADRAGVGLRAMEHGKDFFVDKPPLTTLEQLAAARQAVERTGRKYAVYYSERLHVESAIFAGQLVEEGAIGRVVQVLGTGPHRANVPSRPQWFFEKERYGGILCDIGSHQVEQFLFFTGAKDARVAYSRVANYAHKQYPGLEDFGDCSLVADNGASGYFRVDWFTPDGLSTWGDGRLFLLGTDGYIELRKYTDVAREPVGDQVYMVDGKGEHHFSVHGQVGYPYFGQLVRDCLDRTETAMSQEHAFKAAELCITAELSAERLTP